MEQTHKTFGAPPEQEDLKNRIDSSDQDENASYEELNEEDLKSNSSSKKIQEDDEDDYS
jgi:hypothetical protein